ncbi:arginine/serine-rich coiled-coil protein 2 isoform X2 [Phalaenopsis equestris]|uniref:arginine/serine-rich coiled-coil protein 2 isoform X2 n=1 Tax=Phalaenopsis equestris TaxID=78828 RepID=UPI0009E4029D|nr:arginine/serine-rich coiled-coil protein 2 isoform X2 [Phalaenopsis equestris]
MNLVPPKDSPDKSDLKPSFRKPSNDSVNRKYRHYSPVDGSDSSSSGGIPKREHHNSSGNSMANRHKLSDDRDRKYHEKEPVKDPGHSHSTRGSDSYRYSDKKTSRSSANYQHSDDGGYHRLANDEDRDSNWYSKDGRELRSGRLDFAKHNDSSERFKEISRNPDRNVERYDSREKYENSGHRSRGKDREENAPDHRYNEIESSRAAIGSRQMNSRRDNKRGDERDSLRERDDRDERRMHHRSPSDCRKEYVSSLDDSRGHAKDSFSGRESAVYRQRESQRKEVDEQDYQVQKRRYNDKDTRRYEEKYPLDHDKNRTEKSDSYLDKNSKATEEQNSSSKRLKSGESDKFPRSMAEGKSSTSSNQLNDGKEKFTFGQTSSANNHAEPAQDFNAAKVAAMKAAELVNRNLVGTGGLSTDQKKKLLWGSKNSSEESGSRWDLQLFTDRERQEKFNKLMGVKGEAAPQERKPDEKDAEKQKELQMDLEKQYTAGLRRRDGRTVGLGL